MPHKATVFAQVVQSPFLTSFNELKPIEISANSRLLPDEKMSSGRGLFDIVYYTNVSTNK